MDLSKYTIVRSYRPLFYLLIVFYLASCGVSRNTTTQPSAPIVSTKQQDLIDFAMRSLGRPYRAGGRGPNNFDCSGFVRFVFAEFGYNLQGGSAAQDQQFPSISRRQDLRVGDLVFFEGRARNSRVGHVGIVTETQANGNFRFIHAAVTGGVIVSHSTEPYWSVRYLRGGRVLRDDPNYVSQPRTAVANNSRTPARAAEPRRSRNSRTNNQNNAFVPAPPEHREPVRLRVANVAPQAQANEAIITTNEQLASVSADVNTNEPRILVQTNPAKNPPLSQNRPSNSGNSHSIVLNDIDMIRREESFIVPDPIVARVEVNAQQRTHTVRSGETLYSIARQYNTSVEQLRQLNPQQGSVLRVGDVLNTRP